jgi:oxygen-independent coproporphyrinogen-3 oxidase
MEKNISNLPGIYIHFPYCKKKCAYCDFYSITNQEHRESFIPALISEIRMTAGRIEKAPLFDTIYLGGGTPSLLEENELGALFDFLFKVFSFSNDIEITIEANPGTISKEKFKFYRSIGVNRLSIGVQSFDDDELKFLGRIHSVAQAKQTIKQARENQFDNINIDLIFALPEQTIEQWISNLETGLFFQPEHISAYNLIFEKGTPFYNKMLKGKIIPKNDEQERIFLKNTIELLKRYNYIPYELSNYARTGSHFSRHNFKYWNYSDYLGFGPSAHSFWQGKRRANVRSVNQYIEQINNSRLPVEFKETIDQKTMEFENIFLSLRTYSGLNLKRFEETFKRSFLQVYPKKVNDLMSAGLAEIKDDHFRLTQKGLFICDEILPHFNSN